MEDSEDIKMLLLCNHLCIRIVDKIKEHPKGCSFVYISACQKKKKSKLTEDWNKAGGNKVISWYKWCNYTLTNKKYLDSMIFNLFGFRQLSCQDGFSL